MSAESTSLESVNFIQVIIRFIGEGRLRDFLERFENDIFQILLITFMSLVFYFASRRITKVPGKLTAACEMITEGLDGFVCGILGPEGKKHTPFVGSIFLYILGMNLMGLLPLMKSPTSASMTLKAGVVTIPIPPVTAALAILVFFYVQATAIRAQGILGYLDHLAGSPRDPIGYVMVPLMFAIHVIGELAKPFSLAFRLFCNIMGEDVLISVFVGLGVGAAFIPLQSPFILFAIVTSTIQAFVFTLLTTVYLAMAIPHHESHEKAAGGHA